MAITLLDGDILEARIVTNILEQISVNRRYYVVLNSVGGGRTTQDAAEAIDSLMESAYKSAMPTGANYRGVSVQRVSPGPRTVAAVSVLNAGLGTAIGSLLPPQTCGIVALKTDLAGKANRGRAYIPWPSDSFMAGTGKPTAGYVATELQEIGNRMRTRVADNPLPDGADYDPILWKPPSGPQVLLITANARTEWATQRRRGGFGAKNVLPF